MKKYEAQVMKEIKQLQKKYGFYMIRQNAGKNVPSGIPDNYLLYKGFSIFVEAKRPIQNISGKTIKGHPTYMQKKNLDEITKQGGIGVIACSGEFVEKILKLCEKNDLTGLKGLGWQTHGQSELFDDAWMEETIW